MTVNENAYQQTASNHLETDGQKRQFALDNNIPPELHSALNAIDGRSISNLTKADQIAALQNIEHIAEMQNNLLEQGETPLDALKGAVNHAQNQMGYGHMSPADIAILTAGHNGGLRTGRDSESALVLDPYEAEQRRAQLMNNYASGLANRQFSEGAPASLEEVENFARAHGLNRDALLAKLEEKHVEVKNNIVPDAAAPLVGLLDAGFKTNMAMNTMNTMGAMNTFKMGV